MQRKSKPCLAPQKSCKEYKIRRGKKYSSSKWKKRHKDAKTRRHQSSFNDSYGNEGVIYNNDCYGKHKCPHPCMSHPFDLFFLQMFLWFVSWCVSGRRKHCPEVSELCTSHRTETNETSHKRKASHPSSHHFSAENDHGCPGESHGPNFH